MPSRLSGASPPTWGTNRGRSTSRSRRRDRRRSGCHGRRTGRSSSDGPDGLGPLLISCCHGRNLIRQHERYDIMPSEEGEHPRTVSRRLLLTTGLGFSMGFAGCAGGNPSNTPSATPTIQPRQIHLECPPYTVETEITVCGFSASSGDPATLEPNRNAILQSHQDTLEFTLTNHTNRTIEFNPYSWNIRTKSASDWERHQPNTSGDGSQQLTSEASTSWTLGAIKQAIAHSTTLRPGKHAVDIRVPNAADNDASVTCIAAFRVV